MEINKNCGCIIIVHEYDDFPGERSRSYKYRCDHCTEHENRIKEIREYEDRKLLERERRRYQHLCDLAAMELTRNKRFPISNLLKRVTDVLRLPYSVYNQNQLRDRIKSDKLFMEAFRIQKIRNRYSFEAEVLEKSDLILIFK